jgi:hypothetical protein
MITNPVTQRHWGLRGMAQWDLDTIERTLHRRGP